LEGDVLMPPIKKRKKRKESDDKESYLEFEDEESINLFGP